LRQALDLVPDWWGIKVARMDAETPLFRDLKLPTSNPSPDPTSVIRLLWRDEALLLMEVAGSTSVSPTSTRESLYTQLLQHPDFECLRGSIRHCLKTRVNWRSAGTRVSCGD
jgi:hypothetical protein